MVGNDKADTFIPMHDSSGRKLLKLFNEACLLLNNGRIKNSYLIADNRRKISALNTINQ